MAIPGLRPLAAAAFVGGLVLQAVATDAIAQTLSFPEIVEFPVGSGPQWTVAGDFDNDGILDLAVANRGSDSVFVMRGNGAGAFTQTQAIAVGDQPTSIAMDDFDGDGDPDLAVTNYGSNTLSILLG